MTAKPPAFSVIIPLYNKGPHIANTIQTVLDQSLQDYELIIVDDASTDDSLQEAKKLNDPRIRLLQRSSPGPGGYAARNLGIRSACAEWISFLDADDTWEPSYLENMRELERAYPQASILCCGWQTKRADGRTSRNPYLQRYESLGQHRIDLLRFLRCTNQGCPPLCTPIVTMRRELLLFIGGFPEGRCRRGGDVDTWLRGMLQERMAAWHPVPGAVYHTEAVNRVARSTPYDLRKDCIADTARKHLKDEEDPEVRRELKRFVNHYLMFGIKERTASGKLALADVRSLFAGPEPLRYTLYSVAARLPGWLQRGAAALYRRLLRG